MDDGITRGNTFSNSVFKDHLDGNGAPAQPFEQDNFEQITNMNQVSNN
jgi:hypothetical protein